MCTGSCGCAATNNLPLDGLQHAIMLALGDLQQTVALTTLVLAFFLLAL